MPESERNLFQVRITAEEKRRIKTLAASQAVTLQEALIAAFAAWERELKARGGKGVGKKK